MAQPGAGCRSPYRAGRRRGGRSARRWVRWCSTVTESRCSARTPRRPIRCGSTHGASCCSRRTPYGATDAALTGVGQDGKRTPLGSLDGIYVESCSWNEEFLTCPAEDGFRAWRFTG